MNPDGSELEPEKLCVVSLSEGKLQYMIIAPGKQYPLTTFEDTLEEAEAKLAAAFRIFD